MADIRITWEPPIDKSIVDSISIYRYAGETSDCNLILSDGVLVVENLTADSISYDDLGIADSNHYSYGVFSKNVTGFSPCAHASLSLVPTIDGSPTDLTAVYVAAAPVEGPTNIVPTVEVAPKYGIDTGIYVYPLFLTQGESDYYDSQLGGAGTSHTMTYDSVTYYMPDNGNTHAGTVAPVGVTINGNEFNYAQIVTGFENGHKPTINEGPTGLTSTEQIVAPANGPTDLTSVEEILAPANGPTDLTSTEQIVAPANGPTDLTSTEQIVAPANGPTDLTSVEEILAPTSGPTDLTTLANPNEAPSALGATANPNDAPTSLTAAEEILAPTSGPTNLTTLVDADEDGYYADVDLDDNDANTGLYPTNVDITFDGDFSSNTPELYYVKGYSYIRRNGDSPMHSQAGTYTSNIYIRQGQTVTFTNNTTDMFYVRKQTDLTVNLLSIMGVNAPSNTGTYTFNELGEYGWRTTDSGMVSIRFTVVPATASLDSFQILDQGAAAGQSFAGDYNWDYYKNNPVTMGWLQSIEQHGNTTFTIPSGYSTTYATILYRKTGTVWSHTGYGDAFIRFESLSNGQDTKNYLYATFGVYSTNSVNLIYEITDQRPYTLGEVLPSWFISELAAEDYHISYTKRPIDSPSNITAAAPTTTSNQLWNPSDTTFLKNLWLDSTDTLSITESTNIISQWSDKSGNGNHAIQATSSNRPTLTSDGILFDGIDDSFDLTSGIEATPLSIYFLAKADEGYFFTHGENARFAVDRYSNGKSLYWSNSYGNSISTSISFWHTRYQIFEMRSSGGSCYFYINGTNMNKGASWQNLQIDSIGKAWTTGSTPPFTGYIKEILITPDMAKRETIEGYLAHKYGIADYLPTSHLFKTSAPLV